MDRYQWKRPVPRRRRLFLGLTPEEATVVAIEMRAHQRLHQRGFRERVLRAYRQQCALCRLLREELLSRDEDSHLAGFVGVFEGSSRPRRLGSMELVEVRTPRFAELLNRTARGRLTNFGGTDPLDMLSHKYDTAMEAHEREIRLFVRADGSCPFEESLRAVRDKRAKGRIYARIDRLRLGNFGDTRAVGPGVYELRIHHGPGWRVYFAPMGPTRVVLLCAGTKRTQEADVARARTYLRELKHDADKEL